MRASELSRASSSSIEVGSRGAAKLSPSPWSATDLRSGSSSNSHVTRNPTAAIAPAIRKTGFRDAAYAATYGSRIAAGSASICCGPRWAGRAAAAPGGSFAERCDDSWLAKIAPKMGTPIAPPIERNSVAVDVATPRFS